MVSRHSPEVTRWIEAKTDPGRTVALDPRAVALLERHRTLATGPVRPSQLAAHRQSVHRERQRQRRVPWRRTRTGRFSRLRRRAQVPGVRFHGCVEAICEPQGR